jgi:hypothetical protein
LGANFAFGAVNAAGSHMVGEGSQQVDLLRRGKEGEFRIERREVDV